MLIPELRSLTSVDAGDSLPQAHPKHLTKYQRSMTMNKNTTTLTETAYSAEPAALAIAQAMQEAINPDIALLFRSRAVGDYRPHSDADILIITLEENPAAAQANTAAKSTWKTTLRESTWV